MMDQIDIKDLRLIRMVAESGTLTSAATRLHLSQSAVSQRLRSLREHLGFNVFERRDGVMKPTAIGERLIEAARVVGTEIDSAMSDIRELNAGRSDRLRINTGCYTCYRWLPFVIRDMQTRFPSLHIDVVPEATRDPVGALCNGQLEVAIVSNAPKTDRLRRWRLFSDEVFAVMRSDDPLADKRYLRPQDLKDRDLLLYNSPRHALVNRVLTPAGVTPGRIIQLQLTEAIVELARAGRGIAALAGWVFHDLDDKSNLVAVRITRAGFKRTWIAVTEPGDTPYHVREFIQHLQSLGLDLVRGPWREKVRLEMPKRRAARMIA